MQLFGGLTASFTNFISRIIQKLAFKKCHFS
jgi:hypothetical protein